MKTWLKILMWSLFGGGIGFFGGYQIGMKKGANDQAEEDVENVRRLMEEMTKEAAEEVGKNALRLIKETEEVRKEYDRNPAEEDDAEMPEEAPEIGDEDEVERSPSIEFISEEEYYEPGGYSQENLLWYTEDERLWNKDTQSLIKAADLGKCVGYGTMDIFSRKDAPGSIFIRNHILECLFRIDRIDAAYAEERGDTSEEYEEDDD